MSTETSNCDLSAALLTATLSHPSPSVTRCTVAGELDVLTAPVLREQLTKAADDQARTIMVDLAGVTFFAAVGARVLDETHRTCGDARGLMVVGAKARVRKVLDLCQLRCPRYATFELALASCGSAGLLSSN